MVCFCMLKIYSEVSVFYQKKERRDIVLKKFTLHTNNRDEMIEITEKVQNYVNENNLKNGAIIVYCPHTTVVLPSMKMQTLM